MIYGWDLGGAHVKLALVDVHGRVQRAVQVPCELWLGLDRLETALRQAAGEPVAGALHAVTMTGELVDLFQDRPAGVAAITDTFLRTFDAARVEMFAGAGFVSAGEAARRWEDVASANWMATASLVARLAPQAVVIDAGSTTTDIVVVAGGEVHAQGQDDHSRLVHEELVYTGVVRTPVMAIAQRVPFAGQWVGVMAEYFATMADVYRITGDLDPASDQHRTADGRGKSREESMRRLARMVGCDLGQAPARALGASGQLAGAVATVPRARSLRSTALAWRAGFTGADRGTGRRQVPGQTRRHGVGARIPRVRRASWSFAGLARRNRRVRSSFCSRAPGCFGFARARLTRPLLVRPEEGRVAREALTG